MKIFDCITFFDEHKLFDVRYELLKNDVDYFIIIEGSKKFNGESKDFCFNENKYDKKKIRYIKINEFNKKVNLENFPGYLDDVSKNRMLDGLYGATYNDIILFSDCDEIPHPQTIKKIKKIKNSKIGICYQNMSCLDFKHFVKTNWFWLYKWPGTKFMKYQNLIHPKSLKWYHQPRLYDPRNYLKYNIILDKGFHFTWIGNFEKIIEKYVTFKNVHDQEHLFRQRNSKKFSYDEIINSLNKSKNLEKFTLPFLRYEIQKKDPTNTYDNLFLEVLKKNNLI